MSRPKNPDRIPLESAISRTVTFYTLTVLMYDKEAKQAREYPFENCYGNPARIAHAKAKELPGKYMDFTRSDERPELLWLTLDEYIAIAHRAPARGSTEAVTEATEAPTEATEAATEG